MGARSVGRSGGVHDGQLSIVKKRTEGREARMQPEKTVEIDCCSLCAIARLRNRNRWANAVIVFFAEWHDDVQAVSGAALEEDDQLFLVRHGRCGDCALQE